MGKAPRKTPVKKPKAKKPRGLASFMRPTKTNLAKTTKQTNDAPGKTKINTKPITHPKAWNSNKDIRNRIRITSNESQKKVNKTQSIFFTFTGYKMARITKKLYAWNRSELDQRIAHFLG